MGKSQKKLFPQKVPRRFAGELYINKEAICLVH
jgi:hypothetical protein